LKIEQTNLDRYGNPPIPWSRALSALESPGGPPPPTFWLATTGPDRRPHVAGVGALWVDGLLYFTSGDGTRKSRNLSSIPDCSVSVSVPGIDLVIEGQAVPVADPAVLQRLAERYTALGWPATVEQDALTAPYSAPSAGPPPWRLYALAPVTACGVATAEPYGATRWRFQ
jgi:hypothetical protein